MRCAHRAGYTGPMKKVLLGQIAHTRSGDKGDDSNVGVIADSPTAYELLREVLTIERVAAHFAGLELRGVERHEVPNLNALNFILRDSLGGGGTASLKTDAQGKTHGQGMLLLELEVPDDLVLRPRSDVCRAASLTPADH